MINSELLDTILLEWSYRLKDGIPDVNDPEKVKILNTVLVKNGLHEFSNLLLEDTTENESETLCMYFCVIPDTLFTNTEKHLELVSKSKDTITPDPKNKLTLIGYNFGDNLGNGEKSLKGLLDNYNAGFNKSSNKLLRFTNAITSAKLIRSQYGGAIKPANIDRGKNKFEEIKKHALGILNSEYNIKLRDTEVDKWSPADIMIYNGVGLGDVKKCTQLYKIVGGPKKQEPSINSLFVENISNKTGIVGISLKQHDAQGGKALSFKSTLTRSNNYVKGDSLDPDDAQLKNFLYNVNSSTSDAKTGTKVIQNSEKIGYLVEIAKDTRAPGDTDKIKKEAIKTLQATFKQIPKETLEKFTGKNIPGTNKEYEYDSKDPYTSLYKTKDLARASFSGFNLDSIQYSNDFDKEAGEYNLEMLIPSMDTYETNRNKFIKELKAKKYNTTEVEKITAEGIVDEWKDKASQTLIKKAGCYKIATWLLTGLKSGGLQIPAGFKSLAEEQDPFVALTAYAIGFAGISPPFIKVIGADKISSSAEAHPMGGDGNLTLEPNTTVSIIDSITKQGFQCSMKLQALNVKYEVTLDFRYAGDQINIEVVKIS